VFDQATAAERRGCFFTHGVVTLKPRLYQIHVSGHKWIHVAVTTISLPIQDTCKRRQAIEIDTTCIRATYNVM